MSIDSFSLLLNTHLLELLTEYEQMCLLSVIFFWIHAEEPDYCKFKYTTGMSLYSVNISVFPKSEIV